MEINLSFFQEMWKLAAEGKTQGVFFFAAIYTFIVCFYSLIFQLKTRYWPFVHGEIIELGIEKFGATDWVKSNQEYTSKSLYKYNVSGASYTGTKISPWIFVASHNARFILRKQMSSIQLSPDGKVKVFYNPKNPKKSLLIIAGKIGICITFAICLLPLILFYLKYYF